MRKYPLSPEFFAISSASKNVLPIATILVSSDDNATHEFNGAERSNSRRGVSAFAGAAGMSIKLDAIDYPSDARL